MWETLLWSPRGNLDRVSQLCRDEGCCVAAKTTVGRLSWGQRRPCKGCPSPAPSREPQSGRGVQPAPQACLGVGVERPPLEQPLPSCRPASWIPEDLKAAPTAAPPPHPAFPPPSSLGREQALPAPGVPGRPGTLLLCSPAPSSSPQKDAQAAGGAGDTGVSARPKSGAVMGGRAGLCRAAGARPAWMKDGIPLPALSWGPQGHGAP